MKVPRLLNVWLKVSRKWLRSGGPSAAASGIGGHLQDGDSAGQHEQPEQHEHVDRDIRRKQHDHAPGHHQAKRDQHRADGFLAGQQDRRRKTHDRVGDEEGGRAQLRLEVAQLEDALHGGNQGIDQRSDEAPCKEQAGNDRVRAGHCCRTAIRLRHTSLPRFGAALVAAKNKCHKRRIAACGTTCQSASSDG